MSEPREMFVCPKCDAVSFNPNDIRFGYCGRCHDYTGDEHAIPSQQESA